MKRAPRCCGPNPGPACGQRALLAAAPCATAAGARAAAALARLMSPQPLLSQPAQADGLQGWFAVSREGGKW